MERTVAIQKLQQIIGQDLRKLATKFGVTVFRDGKKNKGWAGHVIERYLGLPLNSAQSPNFGSWELKVIPLKYLSNGTLKIKETMAITMIDAEYVKNTPFENSHLLAKLQKAVIAARIWTSKEEEESKLYTVTAFNLDNPAIYNQVREDYESVRNTIITRGFSALTGRMGVYIQPRTKGPGHGSISRAFYARVPFLTKVVFPNL
ncbi:MutH/Sau3AI family endonuclease [Anaerohalosphaeraceae bacterium U12dextr]